MRVASLLPSATETVCALGRRGDLVGVSHECDHPPDVVGLPVLTRPKVALGGRSGEIDRDVRAVVADALAVYDVRVEELDRVRPDVVVTQDLCDVCAVSLADVERAVRELTRPDVRIVDLHPTRLDEVLDDVRRVGQALGCDGEAGRLVAALRGRLDALRARAAACPTRPRVLTIEWIDPVMVGGTWMPELVALAGGEALVTRPGEHAPTLESDALAALDPAPDVVLVKPCGFPLERTRAEADALRALLASMPWPAVREGRVFVADGNAFFNRPGPRLVESAEILAACLQPEAFRDFAEAHAGDVEPFAV